MTDPADKFTEIPEISNQVKPWSVHAQNSGTMLYH